MLPCEVPLWFGAEPRVAKVESGRLVLLGFIIAVEVWNRCETKVAILLFLPVVAALQESAFEFLREHDANIGKCA